MVTGTDMKYIELGYIFGLYLQLIGNVTGWFGSSRIIFVNIKSFKDI